MTFQWANMKRYRSSFVILNFNANYNTYTKSRHSRYWWTVKDAKFYWLQTNKPNPDVVLHFDIKTLKGTSFVALFFLSLWLFLKGTNVSYCMVHFCPVFSNSDVNVTTARQVIIHKEESCTDMVTVGTDPDVTTALEVLRCNHFRNT